MDLLNELEISEPKKNDAENTAAERQLDLSTGGSELEVGSTELADAAKKAEEQQKKKEAQQKEADAAAGSSAKDLSCCCGGNDEETNDEDSAGDDPVNDEAGEEGTADSNSADAVGSLFPELIVEEKKKTPAPSSKKVTPRTTTPPPVKEEEKEPEDYGRTRIVSFPGLEEPIIIEDTKMQMAEIRKLLATEYRLHWCLDEKLCKMVYSKDTGVITPVYTGQGKGYEGVVDVSTAPYPSGRLSYCTFNADGSFHLKHGKIPYSILAQFIAFAQSKVGVLGQHEVFIDIYLTENGYQANVPYQVISGPFFVHQLVDMGLATKYPLVAQGHSHGKAQPVPSFDDDKDEVVPGFYFIIGSLHGDGAAMCSCRYVVNGKRAKCSIHSLFEHKADVPWQEIAGYPPEWDERLIIRDKLEDAKRFVDIYKLALDLPDDELQRRLGELALKKDSQFVRDATLILRNELKRRGIEWQSA